MTADLIAFLRARADADAQWAEGVLDCGSPNDHGIARRTLREVEAKRRIIVRYEDQAALLANHMGGILTKYLVQELLEVVRLLALPYDDHPDYREEWRP